MIMEAEDMGGLIRDVYSVCMKYRFNPLICLKKGESVDFSTIRRNQRGSVSRNSRIIALCQVYRQSPGVNVSILDHRVNITTNISF